MNKLVLATLLMLVLIVPMSAYADTRTYSVKDIFTVKTVHVGDVITIVNDDTQTHSIVGKDSTGRIINTNLPAGTSTQLQFFFPLEFAFYDQYAVNKTGIIYVFDPNKDLSTINVYNNTSTNDLFEKPVYLVPENIPVVPLPIQNTTSVTNGTSTNSTGTNSTTTTSDTTTTTTSGGNTTPAPVQQTTPVSSDIVAQMKAEIALLQSQVNEQKTELQVANGQITFWQQQANNWETVAERIAQAVQNNP